MNKPNRTSTRIDEWKRKHEAKIENRSICIDITIKTSINLGARGQQDILQHTRIATALRERI